MGTARRRRALFGTLAFWCALLAATGVVRASDSAHAAPAPADEALTSVAVPYLGSTTIEPGAGWQITDCDTPRAATSLVTGCEPTKLTLATTTYDPDAGTIILPVPQSNGTSSVVFNYSVTLTPPEAPAIAATTIGYPVAAGSTVMLPLSELGIECRVCTTGGAVDVVAVDPLSAGSAAATGTHIVFRPSATYTGAARLILRFADDHGSWSPETTVEVPVYRPAASLVATSVYVGLESVGVESAGQQPIDLRPLVFAADAGDVHFIGCGAAVHGTVVCASDGTAVYIPSGASVDQFSYQVATATGEQATGSVTIVGDQAELPAEGLVPASAARRGDDGVPSMIVPRLPVDVAVGRDEGIFSPLIGTLDRVGT